MKPVGNCFTRHLGMILAILMLATGCRAMRAGTPGTRSDRGTDVVQYLPLALPWIAKAAGVETRSGWVRMAVSQGAATVIMAGVVEGLKHTVRSTRPDGSDRHSFPSGHAAWSFMGATTVARELGPQSWWYTAGAFTVATAVAVERVVDKHHHTIDVIAGAAIGVASAELGYLIGNLCFNRPRHGNLSLAISPAPYPSVSTRYVF